MALNLRFALCMLAAALLAGAVRLPAQEPARRPAASRVQGLKIFVLSGTEAVHRPSTSLYSEVIVEIRDEQDLPVEGANVRFVLSRSGPGGTFSGEQEYVTRTNSSGQATALGFEPNGIEGRFPVEVIASHGSLEARTVVYQVNSLSEVGVTRPAKGKFRKRMLIAGIAAGATTALVLVLRGSSSSDAVTLTPGPVVIGGPR